MVCISVINNTASLGSIWVDSYKDKKNHCSMMILKYHFIQYAAYNPEKVKSLLKQQQSTFNTLRP